MAPAYLAWSTRKRSWQFSGGRRDLNFCFTSETCFYSSGIPTHISAVTKGFQTRARQVSIALGPGLPFGRTLYSLRRSHGRSCPGIPPAAVFRGNPPARPWVAALGLRRLLRTKFLSCIFTHTFTPSYLPPVPLTAASALSRIFLAFLTHLLHPRGAWNRLSLHTSLFPTHVLVSLSLGLQQSGTKREHRDAAIHGHAHRLGATLFCSVILAALLLHLSIPQNRLCLQ